MGARMFASAHRLNDCNHYATHIFGWLPSFGVHSAVISYVYVFALAYPTKKSIRGRGRVILACTIYGSPFDVRAHALASLGINCILPARAW